MVQGLQHRVEVACVSEVHEAEGGGLLETLPYQLLSLAVMAMSAWSEAPQQVLQPVARLGRVKVHDKKSEKETGRR